ncbi:MAG: LUD domain-containing protein [Halioglobus sp.]
MSTSARSDIFARLRHATNKTQADNVERARAALGSAPRPGLPAAEMCEAFLLNVVKNRGGVACASGREQAVRAVADHLYKHYRNHRLVAGNDPRLAAMPWRDAGVLPRFGAVEPGEQVTLSFARLGIAELGGVVTYTGRSNPAANNLLPERHIVLLNVADLVGTMEDGWEAIHREVSQQGRPRGINIIAGPSSTADIEGQLVYGAHGPRHWHVILIGAVPAGALERAQAAGA